MKLDRKSLRSQVARRIFFLFVACALLPIGILAVISFTQVTDHLNEQSGRRLRQASKAAAMSIYERLLFLESDLKMIASLLATRTGRPSRSFSALASDELGKRFRGMGLITPTAEFQPLFGRVRAVPPLTPAEREHVEAGGTLLISDQSVEATAGVFMIVALDAGFPARQWLIGELSPSYLWRLTDRDTLSPMTELCVLDSADRLIVCSLPDAASLQRQAASRLRRLSSGQFEWEQEGETYLASYWSLPLRFKFYLPNWTVVLSESKTHVLAPVKEFQKKFPLVVLTALGFVTLLSMVQIRRRLDPLEKLQEGTRRIARRDFDKQVTVKSGDEFEELAASFNTMARQLGAQFATLATMAEIDRAVLSALDTGRILETVLSRIGDVFPYDCAGVALWDVDASGRAQMYLRDRRAESRTRVDTIAINAAALEAWCGGREAAYLVRQDPSHPLAPVFGAGMDSLLIMPLFLTGRLSGIIALGYLQRRSPDDLDLTQARQLADQVAVAIHNSQLYEKTRQQAEELERASRVKGEFLSIMSHELRTPLTIIMGYAGIIREQTLGEINPEQEKTLQLVIRHATELLSIVNSIIEATDLETGAAKLLTHELDLNKFLGDLRVQFGTPMGENLTLVWDYPADLPPVRIDAGKLRYIVQQLIGNALKFTERGHVTVSVRLRPHTLQLRIADTGIGIPKEALPIIFEKFRQVDSSTRRSHGGIGLGLFIVDKFTFLLGGKIEVESQPGVGSTFTVTLPCDVYQKAHT